MQPFKHPNYIKEIDRLASMPMPWASLRGARFLITGGCGMIGSYMVDVLLAANKLHHLDLIVMPMGRSERKAKLRFEHYWNRKDFLFICADVNEPIPLSARADYIFHAASNTHPVAYATEPISTITTNIIGTNNLLSFASEQGCKRFVFASSVEIYGENRGDCDYFTEDYCGYINCNTLRAGYPESKRAGEALCQAYMKEKGVDVVIPRLPRVYGPTLLDSDTKALSQFIRKALAGEDIVLKSRGSQFFSYIYVADAVYGVLYTMMHGKCGEAYNISDSDSDITLANLAGLIASIVKKNVVFDIPSEIEASGFSKATKAVMDSSKLRSLGWLPLVRLEDGLRNTISVMSEQINTSE